MQDAGRILLLPKGDYSADATYEMLDIVNHNEVSWLCKKDCTGQEPSDSNTEFWQKFGTAVDLSNYFPKSGGKLTDNVVIEKSGNSEVRYELKNGNKNVSFVIGSDGSYGIYEVGRGWLFLSDADGNRSFDGTASGNLPNTGGRVSNPNGTPLTLQGGAYSILRYDNANKEILGWLGFDGANKPVVYMNDSTKYSLLHTGNKPTGTYTGNGDATARKIAIGGISDAVLLTSANGFALCTTSGAVTRSPSSGVSQLTSDEIKPLNGYLNLATANSIVNGNGVEVTYRVL